jgi:hypothetical protein
MWEVSLIQWLRTASTAGKYDSTGAFSGYTINWSILLTQNMTKAFRLKANTKKRQVSKFQSSIPIWFCPSGSNYVTAYLNWRDVKTNNPPQDSRNIS